MEYEIMKEQLSDHLWRFVDASRTACYLVVGETKAALLDTGIGIGNLRDEIETVTKEPLIVILTHGHLDHIGGASQFEDKDIYLNPADSPMIKQNTDIHGRADYARDVDPNIQDEDMKPAWNCQFNPIEDNQTFNLGSIHIQMISVPGHTQGMMCPLIIEDRTIIFGDACGVFVMLFDQYSSVISDYLQSLHSLQKYEPAYDIVYRNHGTFTNQKDLLENVIECCTRVLAGTDDHIAHTIHGRSGYVAKAVDPLTGIPTDGKEGDLFYTADKVR